MEEILKVEDLYKSFPLSTKQRKQLHTQEKRKVAVNHLSFSVQRGEIFGLLGPNGAGKTTTLRMLASLIAPESGDAKYVFSDVTCSVLKDPEEIRRRIGFLTGDLKLEDFFTPDALFTFFAELRGVPADVASARKAELFARFGIDSYAQTKVEELSTGMKQKVSLVTALVHDPEIIIFDEPTNGLDIITERVVTEFLKELRTEGKTIILSTHIFSLVEKLCDRVGIVIDGQMAACDTLEALCGDAGLEDAFFALYEKRGEADA